jgi:hypothetical protein
MPDYATGPTRIRIDSLRVRVPGRDADAGRQFATELSASLAEQADALRSEIPSRSVHVGAVSLSVPATRTASYAGSVSSSILQSIAKAAHAMRGK